MMKLELKKLKVHRELSEETTAFSADVWLDGVYIGHANERGHGGAVNFMADKPEDRAKVAAYEAELATLPKRMETHYEHTMDMQPRTIDDAITELVEEMDFAKRMRGSLSRLLKANTVFVTVDKTQKSIKKLGPDVDAHIVKKYPGSTTLNSMSLDDAVAFCVKNM